MSDKGMEQEDAARRVQEMFDKELPEDTKFIVMDSHHGLPYLKAHRAMMKQGDLFFECDQCGRVPTKIVQAKKIGMNPAGDKVWWLFCCPGCLNNRISVRWR
jgi:hypothetical protein